MIPDPFDVSYLVNRGVWSVPNGLLANVPSQDELAKLPQPYIHNLARLAAFNRGCGTEIQESLAGFLDTKNTTVFENGPSWADIKDAGFRCAAAIFPLATTPPEMLMPDAVCLWLFLTTKNADSTPFTPNGLVLEGWADFVANFSQKIEKKYELSYHCTRWLAPTEPFTGTSWTLAGAVALELLLDPLFNHMGEARLSLARDWIITGELAKQGAVKWVNLDNKPKLSCQNQDGEFRRWLVADTQEQVPPEIQARTTRVQTIANALVHVAKGGILRADPVSWTPGGVLHVLVSENVKPVVLAALLARPSQIVLWPSDDPARSPATHLAKILTPVATQTNQTWTVRTETPLRPGDLPSAAAMLATAVNAADQKNIYLLLNTGAALTRFAALDTARALPQLTLCYRDPADADRDFVGLRYDSVGFARQQVIRLAPTDTPDEKIDWGFLLRRETLEERRLSTTGFVGLVVHAEQRVLYVCAARQIQRYVMEGDGLRELIGASALVHQIEDVIWETAQTLEFTPSADESSLTAAGGVWRAILSENDARRLACFLPLRAAAHAPGLMLDQAIVPVGGSLAAALQRANEALREQRSIEWPVLPVAGPLVYRDPRSGEATVGLLSKHEPNSRDKNRPASAAALRKRAAADKERTDSANTYAQSFDEIAPANSGEVLALLHIDTNGLDRIVTRFLRPLEVQPFEAANERFTALATGLDIVAQDSLAEAEAGLPRDSRTNKLPLRRLVCAGDDVTVVLRGAHAWEFTQKFLEAFERHTWKLIRRLGVPELGPITACAGLVYFPRTFPYATAYSLCTRWCRQAKQAVDRRASAVSFGRITTALADDSDDVFAGLTWQQRRLSLNPYVVGSHAHAQPTIAQLNEVVAALEGLPLATFRDYLEAITRPGQNMKEADAEFKDRVETRWRNHNKDIFKLLEKATSAITGVPAKEALWYWTAPDRTGLQATPLYDALQLLQIKQRSQGTPEEPSP